MKFFAVLSLVVALAAASPIVTDLTLEELSAALQDPSTDPALVPALEDALNNAMWSLVQGETVASAPATGIVGAAPALVNPITVIQVAPSHWTYADINNALANPSTNPVLIPYLNHAKEVVMEEIYETLQQESILIAVPQDTPLEIPLGAVPAITPIESTAASKWTLQQLNEALQDPDTNAALIPYLENALNHLMQAIFNGANTNSILVVVPTSVSQDISLDPTIVEPAVIDPIVVEPEVTEPIVETPVVVEPEVIEPIVETPAVVETPIVIETPEVEPVEVPSPIVLPTPPKPEVVDVAEQPIVSVVDQPIVAVVEESIVPIVPVVEQPLPVSPVTIEQGVEASSSPLVQLIININQE